MALSSEMRRLANKWVTGQSWPKRLEWSHFIVKQVDRQSGRAMIHLYATRLSGVVHPEGLERR